jgi:hypothetical protein
MRRAGFIMLTVAVALIAGVSGCEDNKSGDPAGGPSSSATSSAAASTAAEAPAVAEPPPATITVNGEPIAMQTALVYSRGGRALRLFVSSAKRSCEDAASPIAKAADEVWFRLRLAPTLQKDGSEKWGITHRRFLSLDSVGEFGDVTVVGSELTKEAKVQLKLDWVAPKDKLVEVQQKLHVEGTITARGCGVLPAYERVHVVSAQAKARLQKDLNLTVAGKTIPIQGATIQPTSDGESLKLTLSSQPLICKAGIRGADVVLHVFLSGDPLEADSVRLQGDLFGAAYEGDASMTAKADGPLDGSSDVTFSLDGKVDDAVGYSMTFSGKVVAEQCKKKE